MIGMTGLLKLVDSDEDTFVQSLSGERLKKLSDALKYIADGYRKRSENAIDIYASEEEKWHSLVKDARELLAEQYNELAEIIRNMAPSETTALRSEVENILIKSLTARNLRIKNLAVFNNINAGREIHMIAKAACHKQMLGDEVAADISQILDTSFILKEGSRRIIGNEYNYYVFRQRERYLLRTGAVRAAKNAGDPSGDNYSVIKPGFGEAAIVLSDGMGSGRQACRDSTEVIELVERFLQCGFRGEGIVSLVSSVLLMGTEAGAYSTLDMCLINLFTGKLKLVKSGASLTFIKHEDWVETISSSGLPLGILPEVKPVITDKKIYHGDSVIVLSDGVLDGIPVEEKESLLQEMIKELPDMEPKDMAGAVLMASLRKNYYEPIDDMTVIVGRLERIKT